MGLDTLQLPSHVLKSGKTLQEVLFVEYVLRTFGLCKKYKRQFAVNQANMNICRGDIYGFVGENGSGKTTIIRLITGLIHPDGGSFELFGVPNTHREIGAARRKLGAVVETPSLYRNMSAYDNLKTQCAILGIDGKEKIPAGIGSRNHTFLVKEGFTAFYPDSRR